MTMKYMYLYMKYLCFVCFQLFYSFFKSLVGKDVVVELKNDLRLVLNCENQMNHFTSSCYGS